MKNKKRNLIIFTIYNLIILGLIIFVVVEHFFCLNPNKIFNKTIDSIIEVKASSEDIGESFGTGIIYNSDGLIITNAHVICYTRLGETNTFDNYEIRFATKEDYQSASLLKYDIELDLAILEIGDNSIKYNPIKFSKNKCSYGDKIYAIGNTSNYGIGISEGVISVPLVNIKYDEISRLVIQADINISSGNSGGALLNDKGQLIGITTFRTKDNQGNVNYGFTYSIPLDTIKDFIKEE